MFPCRVDNEFPSVSLLSSLCSQWRHSGEFSYSSLSVCVESIWIVRRPNEGTLLYLWPATPAPKILSCSRSWSNTLCWLSPTQWDL